MKILVTLTTAGSLTGPFHLYSDSDGFYSPLAIFVQKSELIAGYFISNAPNNTTKIRVKSINSDCSNYTDITVTTL